MSSWRRFDCPAQLAHAMSGSPGASVSQSELPWWRIGDVRFKIYHAGYKASVAAFRDALGAKDFECARADGAALSTEEATAYARWYVARDRLSRGHHFRIGGTL